MNPLAEPLVTTILELSHTRRALHAALDSIVSLRSQVATEQIRRARVAEEYDSFRARTMASLVMSTERRA
jgi:hypothetical protein